MSRFLAAEWDERYQTSGHNLANPRAFLMEVLPQLPKEGWGLDVAMGEGHNANLLVKRGLQVIGVDFSRVALNKAKKNYPQVQAVLADLPVIHLKPGSLDVILNFWFLDRKLFPVYHQLLKPGGFLVLETMRFDPDRDQSHLRLEYLIQPGELLQSFSGWEFLVYDENVRATVKGQSQQAVQLLARKPVSET